MILAYCHVKFEEKYNWLIDWLNGSVRDMIAWKREPTSRSDKELFAKVDVRSGVPLRSFRCFMRIEWFYFDTEMVKYLYIWAITGSVFVFFFLTEGYEGSLQRRRSPVLAHLRVALRDRERARTPLKVEYRLWSDFLYDAWKTNHRCPCRPSPQTTNASD